MQLTLLLAGVLAATFPSSAAAYGASQNPSILQIMATMEMKHQLNWLHILPDVMRGQNSIPMGGETVQAKKRIRYCSDCQHAFDLKQFVGTSGRKTELAFIGEKQVPALLAATARRVEMLFSKESRVPLEYHLPTPSPTLETLGQVATLQRVPGKRCPMCGTPCSVMTTDQQHGASQCEQCNGHS